MDILKIGAEGADKKAAIPTALETRSTPGLQIGYRGIYGENGFLQNAQPAGNASGAILLFITMIYRFDLIATKGHEWTFTPNQEQKLFLSKRTFLTLR